MKGIIWTAILETPKSIKPSKINYEEGLKVFLSKIQGKHILCSADIYNNKLPIKKLKNVTIWIDREREDDKTLLDFYLISHEDVWCIGGEETLIKYAHLFTELQIIATEGVLGMEGDFISLPTLKSDCDVTFTYI